MKLSMLFKCSAYFLASQLVYAPLQAHPYIDVRDNLESIAAQIEHLCSASQVQQCLENSDDDFFMCVSTPNCQGVALGNSLFRAFAPDQWYSIRVPIVPDTALLSRRRTAGFTEGDISLDPSGLTINKSGSYNVSFSAILQNPNACDSFILPIFLAANSEVDPAGIENLAVLPAGSVVTVSASGILTNVAAGTRLTLRIGNSPSAAHDRTPLNVISWSINLSEIPCQIN